MTTYPSHLKFFLFIVIFFGLGAESFALTGPNGKIAFMRAVSPNVNVNFQIFTANPDGTDQTNISNNSFIDRVPQWSADGRTIIFLRGDQYAPAGSTPYTMDADGSNQRPLFDFPLLVQSFSLSPDGSKVVYSIGNVIYVMNIDGTDQHRLTNDTYDEYGPVFSPDGTKIAFVCLPSNNRAGSDICVINSDGSNEENLTKSVFNTIANERFPAWSPDGSKIAFVMNPTITPWDRYKLYVVNADGSHLTYLSVGTGELTEDLSPAWSPDGAKIAISRSDGGNVATIFVIDSDGSNPTRLTNSDHDYAPSWQHVPRSSVPFDFDGDRKADVSVYRSGANSEWWMLRSSDGSDLGLAFGTTGDQPAPVDFTGDGKTDIAVWRPSDGTWYILRSEDNGFYGFPFGASTDIPVPADYDGDGKADAAVYRPSTGTWYILGSTAGFSAAQFGVAEDRPLPGDYDGDGKADIAVFRPSTGAWYILGSRSGFAGVQFGLGTDLAVPADYDGDGKVDVAVYRPSEGTWYIYGSSSGFYGFPFGAATDIPTTGDFDGDGRADAAVFRPSDGAWYILGTTNGFTAVPFGIATDQPVPGAFVK